MHTRKPMTEKALAEMAARNEHRQAIARRALGTQYAHHPSNHVQRRDAAKPDPVTPQLVIRWPSIVRGSK